MPNGLALNQDYPCIEASQAIYRRALSLIPSATQTLAKGPTQHVYGVAPLYLARGRGAHVWDVDGNEFLDLTMALGPLSLGYADPTVDAAIREQLEQGITFSLMHPLEVEVAALVRELVPQAEMVRFSKTGAEVTSAAVRLARASTGRDAVVCCGYHGWHDWYAGTLSRRAGVPQAVQGLTRSVPYGDLDAMRAAVDADTACVVLELPTFNPPTAGYLEGVRALCDERGALLVLDEMWTGFRVALGGAQQAFGVRADLVTFSKAIANGMPLSVLCGRAEVMRRLDQDVFFYTTFGGEALSLAAARATLHVLREDDVPTVLAARGARLQRGYQQLVDELELGQVTACVGLPCRTMVTFSSSAGDPLLLKSLVQQELIRCGVLWSGFHNLSYAHSDEDLDYLLRAYQVALRCLRDALAAGDVRQRLRGEPIQSVFRAPPVAPAAAAVTDR